MTHVDIFTDGSARGNPNGPGGYGAVIRYVDSSGKVFEKELFAGYVRTTNNRMELMGVIAALEALNRKCEVTLTSDSSYVIKAFNDGWLDNWKKCGWKRKNKPLLNVDLWKRLDEAASKHDITWVWVKGHAGHPDNERCDKLATAAADGEDLLVDEGVIDDPPFDEN